MKRKMDLLDRAHGLLCNAPGDGGTAEDGDEWRRLRAEWIERWHHLLGDQRVKEHNRRVAVGNAAITAYEQTRYPVRTVADAALYEQLAAVQHDIWSHWMRYLLGRKAAPDPDDGRYLRLRIEDVEQWQRQIDTRYEQLSEREKASDREQVDRYWPLIRPTTDSTASTAPTVDPTTPA